MIESHQEAYRVLKATNIRGVGFGQTWFESTQIRAA
jgi:hypothetical protein